MNPLRILGRRVDPLTLEEILDQVKALIASGTSHQIVTANTLMLLEAEEDGELAGVMEKASMVIPESSGIRWAGRRMHVPLSITPGIDLMAKLCELASREGHSVFLLGSKPGIVEDAAQSLKTLYPGLRIAGTHHGYFKDEAFVIEMIRKAQPTFLFVGMNMPAQEKWIARHLNELSARVAMGVGGSFDVFSGQLQRAPAWMRRLGIEWMYRTLQEPWRWRRIAQLPVFAYKVMRQSRK